jgi:hypothetical protein
VARYHATSVQSSGFHSVASRPTLSKTLKVYRWPRLRASDPHPCSERGGHVYIDLADAPWRRKDNNAAKTSSIPSLLRFPRSRINPTRRLARGLSGRTSIFAAGMCPAPKDRLGTVEAPSSTATTLFIASTLSNSINGLGGGPASASQSLSCSADPSLPRIHACNSASSSAL